MAGFNDDARRDDVRAKVSNYRMHPWGQRVQEHDPAVPDGQTCRTGRLTENVVIGKDDVQQSSFHLDHRYRPTIDGYRRSNIHVGIARTIPQLSFSSAIPLECAALERGCRDEDLGAGLYRARLDTAGRERRDRPAKVKARERGPTAAEGVLGIRCLKHRRPQRSEIIVELLFRDGAGCGCDQAERHHGRQQHGSEPEHNISEPPNVIAHDDSPPSASAPPSSCFPGTISFCVTRRRRNTRSEVVTQRRSSSSSLPQPTPLSLRRNSRVSGMPTSRRNAKSTASRFVLTPYRRITSAMSSSSSSMLVRLIHQRIHPDGGEAHCPDQTAPGREAERPEDWDVCL